MDSYDEKRACGAVEKLIEIQAMRGARKFLVFLRWKESVRSVNSSYPIFKGIFFHHTLFLRGYFLSHPICKGIFSSSMHPISKGIFGPVYPRIPRIATHMELHLPGSPRGRGVLPSFGLWEDKQIAFLGILVYLYAPTDGFFQRLI